MKPLISFLIFGLFNLSFIQPENKPTYKLSFSGVDCYFEILINNKTIYKNENQYKVSRTLQIEKYLEKKDSQQIQYFMYNRHTMMDLTEKSKLNVFVIKEQGEKIDTIHKSDLRNFGLPDEKGKMKYASRIGGGGYFSTK